MASEPIETVQPDAVRRTVMRRLIQGILSLWVFGGAALGMSFLNAPSAEKRPSERVIDGGTLSSLRVSEARFVGHGTEPLYVIRISETEVLALSATCSYMRCVLERDPESGSFTCPCHGGIFDRTGNVLSGPPTRPLVRHQAEVRADRILVHN